MVQTPANTASIDNGRIITVLDNLSSSEEEARERFISKNTSVMSILSPGDMIEVYGGPEASQEQYTKIHEENNNFSKKYGHITGAAVTNAASNNETKIKAIPPPPMHSYAIFQNLDCFPPVVVQGLSAHMAGINIGTNQNAYSLLLVNGMTNTSYLLQSGQLYYNGIPRNVWCDDSHNQNTIQFNCTYTTGHDYLYDITYMGSPGVWEMGVKDENTGTFDLFIEYSASGSNLNPDPNTSVYFENANTNVNWYYGFPTYVNASQARYLVSGQKINWTYNSNNPSVNVLIERNSIVYTNNGKLTGSLLNNGTATWNLPLLLLSN
jgi:hypothetical protein